MELKKQNGSVAEVGIRGAFIVNLIKRKLLSSALNRLGGWVGVLLCAALVEFRKLGFQDEETRWRNGLKLPEDKECGGTGDMVVQYYCYYHFQYITIYRGLLRLVRWNSFWFKKLFISQYWAVMKGVSVAM